MNTIPILVTSAALALGAASAGAQSTLNLGFEEPATADPTTPLGWFTGGVGFEVALDGTVRHGGVASLRIRRVDAPTEAFGVGTRSFPAGDVRGRTIRYRGWIRTEGVTEPYAGLWMRVDGRRERQVLAFDNLQGRGASGTNDWTRYEIELPVADSAEAVYFGVLHPGNGTAWFDDLTVEVDGVPVDVILSRRPGATAEEVRWISERAIPFATDDPAAPLDDLAGIAETLRPHRIVALGEGTHGTREFFRMKHRLVRLLAETHGDLVFAIEANMPEARVIDRYVTTGEGDPREGLRGMYFWTWNTEEVLAMIEWMRAYNASGRGTIRFHGFDMQNPTVALDSVLAFLERADPELAVNAGAAAGEIRALYASLRTVPSPADARRWVSAATGILQRMLAKRDEYLLTASTEEVDWAIQSARVVVQAGEMRIAGSGFSRDGSMAINVRWIEQRTPSGVPIVLWAHNGHVQTTGSWMGQALRRTYGNDYFSVGQLFGDGSYTAYGPRGLDAFPSGAPPAWSLEGALRATGIPRFAVDLREAKSAGESWFSEPRSFRSIGAVPVDLPHTGSAVVDERFDLLVYFDRTEPTRLNPGVARPRR